MRGMLAEGCVRRLAERCQPRRPGDAILSTAMWMRWERVLRTVPGGRVVWTPARSDYALPRRLTMVALVLTRRICGRDALFQPPALALPPQRGRVDPETCGSFLERRRFPQHPFD